MSYVDSNLLQGETVVYRTQMHKILFLGPLVAALALTLLGFWFLSQNRFNHDFAIFSFGLAIFIMLPPYIQYKTSEFAVTNKRVIVKVGLVSRRTMETLLQKIEAVSVDQSIVGRMLNYGTITVIGTGGTQESFYNIANPLFFRRTIQEQTDAKGNIS